jgi:chaperonin cofactor prefoldin
MDAKDVELSTARDSVLTLKDEVRKKQAMIRVLRLEQNTIKDGETTAEQSNIDHFIDRDMDNENTLEEKISTLEHKINEDAKEIDSLKEVIREAGVVKRRLEASVTFAKMEGSAIRLQSAWWKKLFARSTRGELADTHMILKSAVSGKKMPAKDHRVFMDRSTATRPVENVDREIQVQLDLPTTNSSKDNTNSPESTECGIQVHLSIPAAVCSKCNRDSNGNFDVETGDCENWSSHHPANGGVEDIFAIEEGGEGDQSGNVPQVEGKMNAMLPKHVDGASALVIENEPLAPATIQLKSVEDKPVLVIDKPTLVAANKETPTFATALTQTKEVHPVLVADKSTSFTPPSSGGRSINSDTVTSADISATNEKVETQNGEDQALEGRSISSSTVTTADVSATNEKVEMQNGEVQTLTARNLEQREEIKELRDKMAGLETVVETTTEQIEPLTKKCKALQQKVRKLLVVNHMLKSTFGEEGNVGVDAVPSLPGLSVMSAVSPHIRGKQKSSNPTPRKQKFKEPPKQEAIHNASLGFVEPPTDRGDSLTPKRGRKYTHKKAVPAPPRPNEFPLKELGFGLPSAEKFPSPISGWPPAHNGSLPNGPSQRPESTRLGLPPKGYSRTSKTERTPTERVPSPMAGWSPAHHGRALPNEPLQRPESAGLGLPSTKRSPSPIDPSPRQGQAIDPLYQITSYQQPRELHETRAVNIRQHGQSPPDNQFPQPEEGELVVNSSSEKQNTNGGKSNHGGELAPRFWPQNNQPPVVIEANELVVDSSSRTRTYAGLPQNVAAGQDHMVQEQVSQYYDRPLSLYQDDKFGIQGVRSRPKAEKSPLPLPIESPLTRWGGVSEEPREIIIGPTATGLEMQGFVVQNNLKNGTNFVKPSPAVDRTKVLEYVEKTNKGSSFKQERKGFPSLGFVGGSEARQ